MKKVIFTALIAGSSMLTGCQTTEMEKFFQTLGIVEKPFNPDEVTIAIIELKGTLPTYVSNLKTLQQGQLAIRNLQMQLETIDQRLKASKNPQLQKNLMSNFNDILDQRVKIQDKASEVLFNIHDGITKCKRKKVKILNRIRSVLPEYRSSPVLVTKLTDQKEVLEQLDKKFSSLYEATMSTEKILDAMLDYTLKYDNSHPRIYGQQRLALD